MGMSRVLVQQIARGHVLLVITVLVKLLTHYLAKRELQAVPQDNRRAQCVPLDTSHQAKARFRAHFAQRVGQVLLYALFPVKIAHQACFSHTKRLQAVPPPHARTVP